MFTKKEKPKANSIESNKRAPFFQAKLKVGKAGDKYEVEADKMADKVVNNDKSSNAVQKKEGEEEVQQKPLASEISPLIQKAETLEEEPVQKMEEEEPVQKKEEEEVQQKEEEEPVQMMEEEEVQQKEEEEVQAKSTNNSNKSPSIEGKLRNGSGGTKMDNQTKNEMESGFGADFSQVNIHNDNEAAQMSQDIGAQAFTHGNDVYFNKGKYNPDSKEGKHLLAHELTHTVQQKGMLQKKEIKDISKTNNKIQKATEYGAGTGFNVAYSVPLAKNNIEASAGEEMIFGVNASDRDRKKIGAGAWANYDGTGPYQVKYDVVGDAEFDLKGSGLSSHTDNSLRSRNIRLFIKNTWTGNNDITVKATIKDLEASAVAPDTGSAKDPDKVITWIIKKRSSLVPTGLKRVRGAGAVWSPAPSSYVYQGTPDVIIPRIGPHYENQTVLESFSNTEARGFTMSDLKDTWKTANPGLNTPNKVAVFLYGTSNNGTFVFNRNDQIGDRHSGFGQTSPFKATAFSDADGVGYIKTQEYSIGGVVIGTATIERRKTDANGIEVRKTEP